MSGSCKDEKDEKDEEKPFVAKSTVDLQRLKLIKLMKNPEKPVLIPEKLKSKNTPSVPEFVRNVMGSSAGAGSGEFHVYRHLRRKEYSRQKFIQEKGQKELLDEEHQKKLLENKKKAEEATMKRRAKRLKKKGKIQQYKKLKLNKNVNEKQENQDELSKSEDESCSENEEESVEKCDRIVKEDANSDAALETKNKESEQSTYKIAQENSKDTEDANSNLTNSSETNVASTFEKKEENVD